jgi:glycyl-tRNA synthetase beta chain
MPDPAKGELLLELLTEEIPARMQPRAIEQLVGLLRDKLAAAEIPPARLRGYVTPRRLAVIAEGIPPRQPDRTEERRGPRVGAPQPAIDGFLRSAGLAAIEDCEIRDTGRGEFYFAALQRPGRDAAVILPELVHAAIVELPWPKSMRFPAASLRWVRPLTSVICLFEGEVLPLSLDQVPVGRLTRGHRWLARGEIAVDDAASYLARLAEAHVVLDRDERRRRIEEDLATVVANAQVAVRPDPDLLNEVAGLAEHPVVLMGAIDPDFMSLPPEVLTASMRTHQRYFSCVAPDGTPAAGFLFIADNLATDGGRTIVAGNERVLRARLSDARFFWDQDRKVPLAARVEALKDRVYHEKLGSVFDKVRRIEELSGFLAEQLYPAVTTAQAGIQGNPSSSARLDSRFRGNDGQELAQLAQRAAHLAKADLSTGMVGEFPELQGVMGRYYAAHDGEDPRVADAIAEHYKPLGPTDSCPTAPVSVTVALADKLDALAAFFAIGEQPTGSRDPFALRRAALGVIRLILENRLRLPVRHCFAFAVANLGTDILANASEQGSVSNLLVSFIADRVKVHLREQGVRHDLITAVFALAEDDLVRLLARVAALAKFLDTDDGANLLIAYRRAANIVSIEQRRDGRRYDDCDDPNLFSQTEENALSRALGEIGGRAGEFVFREKFGAAMEALAALRPAIDAFFEKVTVNADEPKLRENRLRLLSRIQVTMNQVADFSQIEG